MIVCTIIIVAIRNATGKATVLATFKKRTGESRLWRGVYPERVRP
jgi:hypothetical protein